MFYKFHPGKHLCQSLFFNKYADLRPATLLKKRLWHRCFPVNFVKFLRTPFYIDYLWYLSLELIKRQSCYHIETSQLICCSANQLTDFYMVTTLTFNELMKKEQERKYFFEEKLKKETLSQDLETSRNRNSFWKSVFV